MNNFQCVATKLLPSFEQLLTLDVHNQKYLDFTDHENPSVVQLQ